jgi:hypothetical protein
MFTFLGTTSPHLVHPSRSIRNFRHDKSRHESGASDHALGLALTAVCLHNLHHGHVVLLGHHESASRRNSVLPQLPAIASRHQSGASDHALGPGSIAVCLHNLHHGLKYNRQHITVASFPSYSPRELVPRKTCNPGLQYLSASAPPFRPTIQLLHS